MAKYCKQCGNRIPARVKINGKLFQLNNRTRCLECMPFKSHFGAYKDPNISDKERQERRKSQNREKSKKSASLAQKFGKQKHAREQRKKFLVELKGGKCQRCGYDKCIEALAFHHRDPKTKSFSLSLAGYLTSLEKLTKEAEKCDLLCHNCHSEVNYEEKNKTKPPINLEGWEEDKRKRTERSSVERSIVSRDKLICGCGGNKSKRAKICRRCYKSKLPCGVIGSTRDFTAIKQNK